MKRNFLSYGKQDIDDADIAAVVSALKSDLLTQGPLVEQFEASLIEYVGTKYCIAVSNGTAALHLACLALGIQKGDAVIIPAITFAATSNAVLYAGATPVFADIDPKTLCISEESAEKAIDMAKKAGLKVKAIMPVHYAGKPFDLASIAKFAERHSISVIEDACHALGAAYRPADDQAWQHVGSFEPHISVFSFHPVKHITTGEGGCVLTNDAGIAKKIRMLRSHGITKDSNDFVNDKLAYHLPIDKRSSKKVNPWYHEMQMLGFNYRICDIQAALGISQLKRIEEFVLKRRNLAQAYRRSLGSILSLPPGDDQQGKHSYHLFPVSLDFRSLGLSKCDLMGKLKEKSIGTQVHYLPVFWHPFYNKNTQLWMAVDCPYSIAYYESTLSLPLHTNMDESDVEYCASVINDILETK